MYSLYIFNTLMNETCVLYHNADGITQCNLELLENRLPNLLLHIRKHISVCFLLLHVFCSLVDSGWNKHVCCAWNQFPWTKGASAVFPQQLFLHASCGHYLPGSLTDGYCTCLWWFAVQKHGCKHAILWLNAAAFCGWMLRLQIGMRHGNGSNFLAKCYKGGSPMYLWVTCLNCATMTPRGRACW